MWNRRTFGSDLLEGTTDRKSVFCYYTPLGTWVRACGRWYDLPRHPSKPGKQGVSTLSLSDDAVLVYARVAVSDFEQISQGWPPKLCAKVVAQRDILDYEPKASAKAARLEHDFAMDKNYKAQRAFDRAQEAVVKAVTPAA